MARYDKPQSEPTPVSAETLAQAAPLEDTTDPELAAKLKTARAELAKMRAAKELALIAAEIDRLNRGDVSPFMAAFKKKQEEVRAATVRETTMMADGTKKVMGLYIIPTKSFRDPTGLNGTHMLLPEGSVIKHPIDELPDADWKHVVPAPVAPERQYVAG